MKEPTKPTADRFRTRISVNWRAAALSVVWFGFSALLASAESQEAPVADSPVLVDRTEESKLDFVHLNGMSGKLYFVEMTGGGVASFDYDRDGDQDLYFVQGQMLGTEDLSEYPLAVGPDQPAAGDMFSDRLFRNEERIDSSGNVTREFVDVTDAAGIRSTGYGMGVATGDYDNDGWVDLYVTNFGVNQLLHNNGDGTFSDRTEESRTGDGSWSVAATFFDYDADGWLDLYVGNYVEYRLAIQRPCQTETGAFDYCGPLAYPAARDRLYRNRGDGTFEDASAVVGVNQALGGALGVVVADFDSNRRLDLYVANDASPNLLWMNQSDGTFLDDAVLSGSAVNSEGQPEASMGVVAGDLDGDGSEDLFMVHLTRETNTLYLNDGTGLFREATRESGLGMASWQFTGFGTVLADFDCDGTLDLFIANGAVKRQEEQLRNQEPYPLRQQNQLFVGRGAGRFAEVETASLPALESSWVSRGAAASDLDNDGDLDIVLVNNGGPAQLLGNESRVADWLGLALESRRAGGRGLGVRVELQTASGRQSSRVRTDGSYASARDPRVSFGLGTTGRPEALSVEWPDGRTTRLLDPEPGYYYWLASPPAEGSL